MAKNRDKQRENRRKYAPELGTEFLDSRGTAGYKDPTPAAALNKYIRSNREHEQWMLAKA